MSSTVSTYHMYQIKGLHLIDIETYRKNMLNVSMSEVNTALKKYLDPSKIIIAGAGPIQSKLRELKALERLHKS